jgi:hypothetical protein
MKKLSIIATTSIIAAIMVVGCGDDSDDNPGAPTSGTKGNEGGEGGTEAQGGTKNTAGTKTDGGTKNTAGTKSDAGETTGGTESVAGAGGGGPVEPSCEDVYADRPEGIKDIPVDAMGNITVDTLTSDTIWTLNGLSYVKPGKTLTIEPCTLIEGTPAPASGSLIVQRGAKIHAVGTPNAPIVFTSQDHASSLDWGGVILLGSAPIAPAIADQTERLFEGITDDRVMFGGADADDSSGEIAYVRIEFGGKEIVQDKEINGLSFAGVGSGTTVHHVMVKGQADDCFEWFGGTASADHLICQNADDDMFDTDEGYRGHLQFLFGRNTLPATEADPRGLEWDGNKPLPTADVALRSQPKGSNITLCGKTGGPSIGGAFRSNLAAGSFAMNVLVTGFDVGVDTTFNNGTPAEPTFSITNSLFFGGVTADSGNPTETDNDGAFDEVAWIAADGAGNTVGGDAPAGFDCYANPPVAPTELVEGGTPTGFGDEAATFVGAFGAENWAEGSWVDWNDDGPGL